MIVFVHLGERGRNVIHAVSLYAISWLLSDDAWSFRFPPCYHKGPCAAKFGCSCFQQKHHCQRNCRCSSECQSYPASKTMMCFEQLNQGALRWKGCKCQKKDKPCGSNCKCVKAHRECDVDLCKPCHAR